MVKPELKERKIAAGAELIRDLDSRGFRPIAVFWLYHSERERWELAIGGEVASDRGPRAVFRLVQRALDEGGARTSALDFDDVTWFQIDTPIVARMESVISKFPELNGVRLDNAGIDGMLIEGAYVYQLDRARASAEAE